MLQSFQLGIFLGACLMVWSQGVFGQALSNRQANYQISVSLDTETGKLNGSMVLTWINLSKDTINTVPFHLYLNAFRDEHSTFVKESGGQLRGVELDRGNQNAWGWIEIDRMVMDTGDDLTPTLAFIQPDDGNTADRSVVQATLPSPLLPNDTLRITTVFRAKLPAIFARTGQSGDFFMVAQWFPKIGVWESAGSRYATKGGWNCHQFHAHSEFFADFGVYQVDITVPKQFWVGATGQMVRETQSPNGTKTLHYLAEDVVDFAWMAFPRFVVVDDQWKDVKIRLLLQPEHADQAERHLDAAKKSLQYFHDHLGSYPYPMLTIVDPPTIHGMGAGGMEYPMLITTGTIAHLPATLRPAEIVTVHEFGHQYFMGLLATNEFEEAWLDEGFNTYYEVRIMDELYGKGSVSELGGFEVSSWASTREGYAGMDNHRAGPSFGNTWELTDGYYGVLTYQKPALWLLTLDRMIGRETMDMIMKAYFERWKFKHPCAKDFISIVNEVVTQRYGNRFGGSLDWFFDQVLYGKAVCDFAVGEVFSQQLSIENVRALGIPDSIADAVRKGETWYQCRVEVQQLADMMMPVEVHIGLEDGSVIVHHWDGQGPYSGFEWNGRSAVRWVKIDPDRKILLDINFINNSLSKESNTDILDKYFVKFIFWMQGIFQLFFQIV